MMQGTVRIVLGYVLVTLPVVGAGLFRVWLHHDVVALGYELSRAERARYRLQDELRQLEVELAAERSPARLEARAVALGLEAPKAEQLRRASAGGSVPHDAGGLQ